MVRVNFQLGFLHFLSCSSVIDRSCRSDLHSGWCHKTSHLAEVFCRAPQLGHQISTMWPNLLTSLGIFWAGLKDLAWGLVGLSALRQGSVWNASPLLMCSQTTVPCAQASVSELGQGVPGILQCLSSTSSSLHWTKSWEVSWPGCKWQGSVSAETDCQFLWVCQLFRFLSVPYEQASIGGTLETELSAWQRRSAGPGSSGLDQLSWELTGSQWKWWYFPYGFPLSGRCSATVQMVSISAQKLEHWRPPGTKREVSAIRARVKLLSFLGSWSIVLMPGTLRNICTSASLSGSQAGSVSSSIGAATMSWCFPHSSSYWWFWLRC